MDKDKALKLAGKLATAAREVCESSITTISYRVERLEIVLNEYDNYILNQTKESDGQND